MVPNLWLLNMRDPHFADRFVKDRERDCFSLVFFVVYCIATLQAFF